MNMQMIMQQAKKMQAQLLKEQEELEKTVYEGTSSLVNVKINGKYEVIEVKFNLSDGEVNFSDDMEMLEDMIVVAFNDAVKKIAADKEKKLGKYGQGLAGLM
ncbi:MAG: YbaB/EbfC family nucleoid-associated protein [Acholeplasmatales bacterium]|nr:YbaB/EbfC family nucleoid-associated protein [Acholeplasmatales bacterium]